MTKYIHLILLAAGLSACTVGRNYQRPEVALPATFAQQPATDTTIGNAAWKQFFQDPALQQLLEATVKGNFDLQIALTRIDEAQAYLKQSKAAFFPSVGLNATANTSIPSKNSLNGVSLENFLKTTHIEDFTLGVGLSWEIDVWGRLRRQKEAALATYLQSYEGAKAVQTGLVASVASGYFNLLMLDAQLRVANRNVALSDTIVRMISMQKTAGQVTELAVQQAISQKQSAESLVPQLQQAITIQENALHMLAGELPGGVIARSASLEQVQLWDSLYTGIPASVTANRPDVKATELALQAANANVGVAQASMYPKLSITASGGLNALKASDWFSVPSSLFGTVAGNIAQPIFQQRQLKTQYEVAKVQREQAVISFRQSVVNAVREVSDALVSADKLKEQQRIADAQVQTTNKSVSQARMLFQSGLANYLEVITAQGNTLQAELNQADVKRRQLAATVELYRALGGGWK
ncbi:efflux transporter outer membrane subunit [Chitinophaga horti]|uniref:Efflux transporter outer membrane subunit n=1 Tax=Chitinophaga horti TaxID=2920382 RepID=A0ABY6J3S9_9BACT|nr:efflux transporter outer membrane subunit [Chitinophaga horti]UYQ94323.1 efflux transporter outer membrane subunit [Chitinophaga horti]